MCATSCAKLTLSRVGHRREPDWRLPGRQTCGPWHAARQVGRFVFISSVVALTGAAGQANYAASKAGLIGFARSLARELGSRGITSNVITPGFIRTDMTGELSEERKRQLLAEIPAGRYGDPAEIAAAVRFLASEEAAYVNGSVLAVDGGLGH